MVVTYSTKHLAGIATVMEYVAVETLGAHGGAENHTLAHIVEIPVGIALVEKPDLHVGIPSATPYGYPAVEIEPRHTVDPVIFQPILFQSYYGVPEGRRQHFVGVERQHVRI